MRRNLSLFVLEEDVGGNLFGSNCVSDFHETASSFLHGFIQNCSVKFQLNIFHEIAIVQSELASDLARYVHYNVDLLLVTYDDLEFDGTCEWQLCLSNTRTPMLFDATLAKRHCPKPSNRSGYSENG